MAESRAPRLELPFFAADRTAKRHGKPTVKVPTGKSRNSKLT